MCVFHVTSNKPLEDFVKSSSLDPYRTHSPSTVTKSGKQPFDDYGFSVSVSERDWNDFEGQIEDAHAFVKNHNTSLQLLKKNFPINEFQFDVPYSCRLNEQIFTQSDYLPAEFLKLVGELGIGIELSLYFPSDDDENSDKNESNSNK